MANIQLPTLSSEQIRNLYGVVIPGTYQVIRHIFYDTATYTSGSTTELEFFSVQRTTNPNKSITNFTGKGMLPTKESFLITGVSIAYQTAITIGTTAAVTGAANDINLLKWNGVFTLKLAQKEYGPLPLYEIPAGGGVVGSVSLENTNSAVVNVLQLAANGVPHVSNIFPLSYFLEGDVAIEAFLKWGAAQTLSGNCDIKVMLHGLWFRQVG